MRLIEGLGTRRSLLDLAVHLERRARDRVVLRHRSPSGIEDTTVADLLDRARRYANGLRSAGVQAGDRVAYLMSNSVDMAAFWLAPALAGAVEVPVNTDLRGPVLAHVLSDSEPRVVVAEPEFVDQIRECGATEIDRLVVWDRDVVERWWEAPATDHADPDPMSLGTIMYTSGTTGPSKGVMLSHGYFANIGHFLGIVDPEVSDRDVFFVCTPMFHVDARLMMSATLIHGATLAFAPRFSASTFWAEVRDMDVSFFVFVGAMVSILTKSSSEEEIRATRLRAGIGGPTPSEAYEFLEDRLGVRLMEGFGMTECNGIAWSTPDRRRRGSVGWESGPYEVRVLLPNGEPAAAGQVGEIAVRPGASNLITTGYWKRGVATAAAFRDLWFHTGDLGRFDEGGFLWFLGRQKEVIRRRGENVSIFEVELTLSRAPGILECAAIGVPDELGGEEEILLYVVPKAGESFDPQLFFVYAMENLARFAVPRYVRVVDDLPHTPTGKVEKHKLAAEVDEETIDRLAAITQ